MVHVVDHNIDLVTKIIKSFQGEFNKTEDCKVHHIDIWVSLIKGKPVHSRKFEMRVFYGKDYLVPLDEKDPVKLMDKLEGDPLVDEIGITIGLGDLDKQIPIGQLDSMSKMIIDKMFRVMSEKYVKAFTEKGSYEE